MNGRTIIRTTQSEMERIRCAYMRLCRVNKLIFLKEITTMEVKAERFTINKSDYFEVSLFRYNNESFVNLRSIHDRSDNDLRNEIMNHIHDRSNVDHINYISERLNHSKWFNAAYLNEETVQPIGWTDNELVLLDQHRNSKYPICVHNFEEIDYVPIYVYVHPTLAKNRGETIHIMHLGLLFQLLTRIKGLPEVTSTNLFF